MEGKTKIKLTRPNEWLNQNQPYKIFIDGVEVGTIANNSTEDFFVREGNHLLQCKINWYGSGDDFRVRVGINEVAYLRVKTGMRFYWPLIFLMMSGILINFFFSGRSLQRPVWASYLQLVLVLPGLLYLLYHLIFARKKYLIIEEDKENIFS